MDEISSPQKLMTMLLFPAGYNSLACYKTQNGNGNEKNQIEAARVRQLISEHFDFALSQLNSQCTKSGESYNLEPELTCTYL